MQSQLQEKPIPEARDFSEKLGKQPKHCATVTVPNWKLLLHLMLMLTVHSCFWLSARTLQQPSYHMSADLAKEV